MDRGGVTSTNGRPQQEGQKNARVGHSRPNRSIEDLSEQEFQARFCISDTILIQLTNGKERRGHLVEWVEKASFAHLSKLFDINVARLTNSEARQACLEEREKKRQEGTLRQALAASHLTSSSIVCPLSQKKKSMTSPV
ncbi:hypothetical protein CK203_051249 [Vitis vinifera]|uniref:Uncharacterized protein n=1 Tax=Vitis vinifera TaxID=29760 RepID=A0A438H7W8_VITVI|nr:hypothetical protein CK203_051249 [Vitis vinifera]